MLSRNQRSQNLAQAATYSPKSTSPGSLRLQNSAEIEELVKWFESTGFATGLTYAFSSHTSPRFILKFRLSPLYSKHFVRVKGFISLGGNSFKLSSDAQHQIFTVEFTQTQEQTVREYFTKIFNWLYSDIQFREELKELIALDRKYQQARNALLNKHAKNAANGPVL